MRLTSLLLTLLLSLPAFAQADRLVDEHSYADPSRVRISHLELDLAVDFDQRQLAGTATLDLQWADPDARELVLDTRDLAISRVEGRSGKRKWRELEFALADADERFGNKLSIGLPRQYAQVRIHYATSPEASGLQWLAPGMTAGGKTPFMFSQSQAIHARSWVPLQDTPSVRFTYTARIRTPADVMALMSADNDPAAERDGDYRFNMPQAIPSYLMAIAAGDLVFKPISGRAGVWAEPQTVDRAVKEFEDTEKMIEVTESLYGPYRWERYDLLILPPSFPFGGMENPRLSFITPTVIAGDKSLVSLIAHELAHSWSGNLVTNATWKDMWLNEGFTSYVENRIVEALYGKERADMEFVNSRNGLLEEMKLVPAPQQVLMLPAREGSDPEEALGAVAYDKGAWFLQFLEQRFGREAFDPFLRAWFDQHAFQSATSEQFLAFLEAELMATVPGKVTREEVMAWLTEPGIPEYAPRIESPRLAAVDQARADWLGDRKAARELATAAWTTQEWVYFLEGLPPTLEAERMVELDQAFRFTGTANGELAQRWYPLSERSQYFEARPAMSLFLRKIGRRKLIMPTYEALAATDDGLAFATQIFAMARPGYHPITTASVEALLAKARAALEAAPQ
ncbi:M1 family metallopeptidase [Arenimonas caeni]|jgi:aminopeptidase N|uniref:Aminopeptidase N n=1 Tax=Arenimonas caeni TaxID=2058085 RepID=A0A2P6M8H8_9GAMM|nr:M1 family metallopeptidase [Arenimonas caeni]MDY0021841.1 M1 family metallopeptidase [Arenimonas caeni]PRH82299.1 aminopeptidase [Arenimonas caeni]